MDIWGQVFCSNITMFSPILPVQLLRQSKICCLLHLPDSPDLTPSDFHVFGPLKEAMGGKSIRSDEVQQMVHKWLHSQPQRGFSRGIHTLLKHWNPCMECNGDYIEKWSHFVPFVFNKLWDKKYFKFTFDWSLYFMLYKYFFYFVQWAAFEKFSMLDLVLPYNGDWAQ